MAVAANTRRSAARLTHPVVCIMYNTTFNSSDPVTLFLYSVPRPFMSFSLFGFCHLYFTSYKNVARLVNSIALVQLISYVPFPVLDSAAYS